MPILDTSKNLWALIALQINRTPNAVALEDSSRSLTYVQLDHETALLAHKLRTDHAVGRDDLVGILISRSVDYVVACLAALRAGGAFLVLELAYPTLLLAQVIEDAKPRVVITQTAHKGRLEDQASVIVLDEDKNNNNNNNTSSQNGDGTVRDCSSYFPDEDLDRLCFVSYSSGTTGRPKGIANPHSAPVRSYDLRFGVSDLTSGDRVACNVFFIWEIFRPLLRGATVYAIPDEASYDPEALVEILAAKEITETLMTPTLCATVLARYPLNNQLATKLPKLRTLWFNGEVVYTDLARRAIAALPQTRLLNCYSASETHEIACGDIRKLVSDDSHVCPVGPLMLPDHTYILGEDGSRLGTGQSGELYVGGGLLARGYLNLPETTAEAFKKDRFVNEGQGKTDARMYRTGDTARILPSGVLEITGRVGAMIKIRGYSVVPGAVEDAILKNLAVRRCAVIAHGDGLDRQLLAYVVPDDEKKGREEFTIDKVGYSPSARRALSTHLAHYMLPTLWVQVSSIPTHAVSGKADLSSLPKPPTTSFQEDGEVNGKVEGTTNGHTNGSEVQDEAGVNSSMIAKIWAATLNIPTEAVTPEHTFFDLGGHSLTLANLASQLSKECGFTVPLGSLAEDPTLDGHVKAVRSARGGRTAAERAKLLAHLKADSILPSDIQPLSKNVMPLREANTVFLTGVTGFLGAFLLRSILENCNAHVVCLVRFPDPLNWQRSAGMARLRKHFADLGIWHDSILDRVEILPGNLAKDRLGLGLDAFEELASRVDVIIHAGATVNLVYPYSALRGPNVIGTREILRLASRGAATLHYVSTNGVLPASVEGWDEEARIEAEAVPEQLLDGYCQTKWVAEELVHEATRRGLPVKTYRPGTISGDSTTGSTNAWDLLTALIVESIHVRMAPDVDGWYAEMTPVDFVSNAIVALADNTQTQQTLFHLGEPKPIRASVMFDNLKEIGYPIGRLPWDDWVELWTKTRGCIKDAKEGGESAFTIDILRTGMPTVESLQAVPVLQNSRTKSTLEKCGLVWPEVDKRLFETYTRHFYARGWLTRLPVKRSVSRLRRQYKKSGPLFGKVAIVTGASSGIGEAVAAALVREGASVALAARRIDRLEDLKKRIAPSSRDSKNILIHQTDVVDAAQVQSLIDTTTKELGPVDILISCAGVMYFTMMHNLETEQWNRTVDVNCKGLLNCLASTIPQMLSRSTGHIVAISSDAGRKVFPGLGVYSASKFFVEATLQSLRLETAGKGLRVTSVQPGNTATELLGMSTDKEAIEKYGEPTGAKVLDPEDVAGAIIYALRQPEHVAMNEVLIEPRDEPI